MRILAIRGENLASLEGGFRIELAQPPFRDAGLFAITGPTGSGKTTLLDAACIALFEAVPRGTRPEEVVRHGAPSAFAEVDFVGKDRKVYRAHWSIRRAGGRAEGNLKTPELELICLDTGENLSSTRTETKRAIAERLGLDFGAFKKSVLLAQGEFASFLKAKSSERSALLESLTNTELYSRLSERAFELAKQAAIERNQLAAALGQLRPLSDAELSELHQELSAVQAQRQQAIERQQAAEAAVRWWEVHSQWSADLEKLRLETQNSTVGVDRARLGRLLLIQRLLPSLQQHLAAQIASAQAADEATHADASFNKHTLLFDQARSIADEAKHQHESIQLRIAQQAPEVEAARTMDRKLEALAERKREYQELISKFQRSIKEHSLQALSKEAQHHTLLESIQQKTRFLERHAPAMRAAADPELWSRDWGELLAMEAAYQHAVGQKTKVQEQHDEAAARLPEMAALCANESRQLMAITLQLGISADELQTSLQGAEAHEAALAQALDLAKNIGPCRQHVSERSRERAAVQARVQALSHKLEIERPLLEVRASHVQTLERQKHHATAALSLVQHRPHLRDGAPCPLCGATEHPYARDLQLDLTFPSLNTDLKNAQREYNELVASVSSASAQWSMEQERAQTLTAEIATFETQLTALLDACSRLPSELAPLADSPTASAEAFQAAHQRTVLLKEACERQMRLAHLHQQQHQLSEVIETLGKGLQSSVDRLNELEAARALRRERFHPILSSNASFGTNVTVEELRSFLNTLRTEIDAIPQLRSEAAKIGVEITTLQSSLTTLESQLAEHLAQFESMELEGNTLRSERALLLKGQTVEAHDLNMRQQATEARHRWEATELAHQQAQANLQIHAENRAKAQTRREERAAQLAQTQAVWEQGRGDLVETDITPFLSWSEASFHQEIRRLDERIRQFENSLLQLSEREKQLAAHAENRPPWDGLASAQKAAQAEGNTVQSFDQRTGQLQQTLDQHRQLTERFDALSAECNRAQAAQDRWEQLAELIGSKKGSAFRNFAQGLTFGQVLSRANAHLRELAPRYVLVRSPKDPLDITITDRDLGDESRPVESLSGGETFLVSLALALGLSSLASFDTPVETLFIDEGFGTLDRDTLDIAIAALDRLQSSGRQIGIISHVVGIDEGIAAKVSLTPMDGGKSRIDITPHLAFS